MRHGLLRLSILLLLPLLVASRGPYETAVAHFNAGQFIQAAKIARTQDSADALALAARAQLVVAAYLVPPEEGVTMLEAAKADAERALTLVPDHVDAMLQLALALGFEAKQEHSAKKAKQARELMVRAIDLAPEDPFAHASLAGWHGEIIADMGGFVGKMMFSASRDRALAGFQDALALDPDNIAINTHLAVLLLRWNKTKDRDQARAYLNRAVAGVPRDGFDAFMQTLAVKALDAFNAPNAKARKVAIKALTPFGGPAT